MRHVIKVKEKYFETKCRSVGMFLDGNTIIYFRFQLQLEFRMNKNYFSAIVNFYTG